MLILSTEHFGYQSRIIVLRSQVQKIVRLLEEESNSGDSSTSSTVGEAVDGGSSAGGGSTIGSVRRVGGNGNGSDRSNSESELHCVYMGLG